MTPLTVPADLDSLASIRRHVLEAARQAGLDTTRSYRLALAVDEIATNIITHGYQEAGLRGTLAVDAELDAESLTVTLRDSGAAFDPTRAKDPDIDKPIEERGIGGVGVFLALRNVDQFSYRRVGNENRNVFIMRRQPPADGSR
jgi:serine/threonine-protein kinase RsbW